MRSRTALLASAFAIGALVAAPVALAKSYYLTKAVETFRIQRGGQAYEKPQAVEDEAQEQAVQGA